MPSAHNTSEVAYLLREVCCALVDEPTQIRVENFEEGDSIIFRIYSSPRDTGKLIGKQGRTARSLRIILGANAALLQSKFLLDLVDHKNPNKVDARGDDGEAF